MLAPTPAVSGQPVRVGAIRAEGQRSGVLAPHAVRVGAVLGNQDSHAYTDAVTRVKVFAYGSNLCTEKMRVAAPSARQPQLAHVLGYRLAFNKKSTDGSGKANIVRAPDHGLVYGVVYDMDKADEPRLSQSEGGYERQQIDVVLADGKHEVVDTYIATPERTQNGLLPYNWYKRYIVEGAQQKGLPATYIAELNGIAAMDDAKQARSNRHFATACT